MRLPSCTWTLFSKISFNSDNPLFRCRRQDNIRTRFSLTFSPSTRLVRRILVLTSPDSRLYKPLVWLHQRQAIAAPLFLSSCSCTFVLARSIGDKSGYRAVVHQSVWRFVRSFSLAVTFTFADRFVSRHHLKCSLQQLRDSYQAFCLLSSLRVRPSPLRAFSRERYDTRRGEAREN